MIHTVVVASHTFAFGTSQGFYNYCKRKRFDVIFIGHPLFGTLFQWMLGAVDTVFRVLKTGKTYDLFVGSNNLNASVGLILRFLGKVKMVVYFSPDWVVDRFNNVFLNRIYHGLDFLCVKYSDMTWNSSAVMPIDPMMQQREKQGYPVSLRKKQIQVSDGTEIIHLPSFSKINRYKIGFIGHLRPGMGVEMLLLAFRLILKQIPEATLLIMGSGPLEEKFRKQASDLPVEFTGFIGEIDDVYKKLSYCAIAVAPYEAGSISEFTDPGKVKSYLTAGLPIVITRVPVVAGVIDRKKAGIATNDDAKDFARGVIEILDNTKKLQAFRKNALTLRNEYSWDHIFNRALKLSGL